MLQDKMMNCMTVIVGKAVSASGRVLVAHNEDDPGHVIVRHAIVPAADHASGELIPAEKGLARISQVPHTLGYYWVEYVKDEGGVTAADAYSFFTTSTVASGSGTCCKKSAACGAGCGTQYGGHGGKPC